MRQNHAFFISLLGWNAKMVLIQLNENDYHSHLYQIRHFSQFCVATRAIKKVKKFRAGLWFVGWNQ